MKVYVFFTCMYIYIYIYIHTDILFPCSTSFQPVHASSHHRADVAWQDAIDGVQLLDPTNAIRLRHVVAKEVTLALTSGGS